MFRDASVASADTKVLTEMDESVFCMESIKGYRNIFRTLHVNHVWDSLDNIDFLRKIGAVGLSTETGNLHPTAAGLLVFGYEYEIVREFPQYFLDYQEKFDSKIRWSDRVVSTSGEWSGNLFDFFFKAATKLTSNIKRPFKLDDTPVHKAVREALVNTLVNADYYGRQGIVIQKYPEKFVFENPGSFRIPLQDAFDGGTSDPRNATILKMFSMIDIGERAGSGIPGIVSVWEENFKSKPLYEQSSNPSRVRTTLDISEYVAHDEESSDNGEFQAINAISSDKASDKSETSATNVEIGDKSAINYKDKILEYLKENLEARSQDIALFIGLKQSRTKDYLSELVEEGKIIANGANKNRTYSKK